MRITRYLFLFIIMVFGLTNCQEDDSFLKSVPEIPVENLAVSAGIRSVELSWTKPKGDIRSYLISYLPSEELVVVEDPEATSVVIPNLDADIEYTFSVVWLNTKAQSSPLVSVKAMPLPVPKLYFDGDLVVKTQADIDALTEFYTDITGNVVIGGDTESNIKSLAALGSIRDIQGSLTISSNPNLSSLKAFSDLNSVAGNITIKNNLSLMDYCVLETALGQFNGEFKAEGNSYNPTVEQILLGECKSAEQVFTGDLVLETQADVDAIKVKYTKITGRLKIGNYKNGDITNLSILSNVRTVDFLEVDGNGLLEDLSGLNALDSIITGNLTVRENQKIKSLKGLEALSYMRNDIAILNNPELTTLSGLDNLEFSDEIFIGKEGFNGASGALKPNPKLIDFCALKTLVTAKFTAIQANRSVIESNGYNPSFETIINGECKGTVPEGNVLDGGLRVNTQAEVDALPEYTEITGELVIGLTAATNDITDLSKFSKLTKVGGRLLIQRNPLITDLSGFSSLTSVGAIGGIDVGELVIRENASLETLEGLERLTFIADDFGVLDNPKIKSLKGIENLANVQNRIFIGYQGWQGLTGAVKPNPELVDYCALHLVIKNITPAELTKRDCTINNGTFFSPTFQDIESGNCTESGDLVLDGGLRVNTQAEVDALPEYTEITGELIIGLTLATNDITDLSKFSKLKKVGGRLLIQRNALLTNINGFKNLTSIGAIAGKDVGELVIRENPLLESLEGLEKLTFIADDFGVLDNAKLKTLKGIENLTTVQNRIFIGYQGWQGLTGTVKPNPELKDYCALEKVINSVTLTELQARECTINNGTFFSPSFQDIIDGKCKDQ